MTAFIMLSALMYYMRRDDTDVFADRNEGKVLVMDNPFASTNAEYLLKPMIETAKKCNIQLICFTGFREESILNRFDNVYALRFRRSPVTLKDYVYAEHKAGSEPDILELARFHVADGEQQLTLF